MTGRRRSPGTAHATTRMLHIDLHGEREGDGDATAHELVRRELAGQVTEQIGRAQLPLLPKEQQLK